MKTYEGNILIDSSNYEQWNEKLKDCEKITGYLSIYSQAKLDNLKSVGGNLYINSQAKLEAPELKSVGGYLYINSRISEKLIKQLYFHNSKKTWYINDQQSEWIYSKLGKLVL